MSGSKIRTGDDRCWTEKPLGVGRPVSGVQIAHKELCASDWLNPKLEDRFVHVIARPYAHLQQARALVEQQELQHTRGILAEGATEFTSEPISGEVTYSYLARCAGDAKLHSQRLEYIRRGVSGTVWD